MKINVKLFLLTFAIITIVSGTSAFIYNILTHQLLKSQQSKALVNSANDFIFEFQKIIQNIDEDFQNSLVLNSDINAMELDFLFQVNSDSTLNKSTLLRKSNTNLYTDVKNLSDFLKFNTNLIVKNISIPDGQDYYGRIINSNLITKLSEKIRAEIAFVERDVVTKFSNNQENQYYLPYLSRVTRELKNKNNFELLSETINDADFSATHYSPKSAVINQDIDFIIFNISKEASTFKSTMTLVTLVIVISGIFLTIISLLLFTTKFRKQVEFINEGVEHIAKGNSDRRVKVISKDEIGNLGNAFNNMLEEIEKRDLAEKEYSEFISLINQKPTLEEIGDATLSKIVTSTSVDAGALYLVDGNVIKPFSVLGLTHNSIDKLQDANFYKNAVEKKELLEIHFQENSPIIQTGIAELKINYLYILPIFYNQEVIAILELALVNNPKIDIKKYLNRIKDQLAIGLANGKALSELKKMVEELQNLNNAYQIQNQEITEKNDELLSLHGKLKKGSKDLEYQTAKAVASEKVKSQFLANMSHELRTPQNSMLGLTELILKDPSTPAKTKERLNVVLRNGKKLLTLIENILEYSKLESGNSEIIKTKINLSDLLSEVKTFIAPMFLEREIEFVVNKHNNIDYELNIDVKKVEQIIYNLIGNAAKFTKKGFVKLSIDIKDESLEIIVEDTGPGISDEDKEIIFDEFRQADANLNRKYSGSGLGLAICKRYSELFNGKIDLTSTVGIGSKFIVTLPNVVTDRIDHQNKLSDHKNSSEDSTIHALIISDGDDSIKLISDYLASNNIKVSVANSNHLANEENLGTPEIIILDVMLNNHSGWNYLNNLKSNPKFIDIPVIVVNMDEEANCGLGLNIYQYCSKELNKQNIHRVIELIEARQSIKFRKIMFITDDEKYNELENDLISDEIKIYHTNGNDSFINEIKRYEPDVIIVDLYNEKINAIKTLTTINDDISAKTIPIIAYIHSLNEKNDKSISNNLIETTLVYQYHPLDVLKIIKDRIDLYDSSIITNEDKFGLTEYSESNRTVKQNNPNNKVSILIVDDDADARFTIGEIVKSLGYETVFATNGYECLEKLKMELPDLILLDIMMPKMDGFQTIKKIREHKDYENLNVFALTAYAMLSDKDIIEKNGFDGLFTKPLNTSQIERKLNQIFEPTT